MHLERRRSGDSQLVKLHPARCFANVFYSGGASAGAFRENRMFLSSRIYVWIKRLFLLPLIPISNNVQSNSPLKTQILPEISLKDIQ